MNKEEIIADLKKQNKKLLGQVEVLESVIRNLEENSAQVPSDSEKCCPVFEPRIEQDKALIPIKKDHKNCGNCVHWHDISHCEQIILYLKEVAHV